jgi:hypothetical protein
MTPQPASRPVLPVFTGLVCAIALGFAFSIGLLCLWQLVLPGSASGLRGPRMRELVVVPPPPGLPVSPLAPGHCGPLVVRRELRPVPPPALTRDLLVNREGRFIPVVRGQEVVGYQVYAIRPQNLLGRAGLQNGDTILRYQHGLVRTPHELRWALYRLAQAERADIQVERRGQTMWVSYDRQKSGSWGAM